MPSLSNIPEPTQGFRPDTDPPAVHKLPTPVGGPREAVVDADAILSNPNEQDQPEHQIDSVSCLLLLLVAGGLLRIVLGLFGPLQGIDSTKLAYVIERGRDAVNGEPDSAFPLFDVVASGVSMAGLPGWFSVALGSVLTLGSIPAAYLIGRALTGRRVAGVFGASMLAVHPAVLTASNALSGMALAIGLTTIGLALACEGSKRGMRYSVGGGLLLGLAGLAAPLCWLVGALAGPLVGHLSLHRGQGQALRFAFTVFILATAPVFAFRVAMFGASPDAVLPEFHAQLHAVDNLSPIDRFLVTTTDPSLSELGEALNLPLSSAGRLNFSPLDDPAPDGRRDVVADTLADGWLLINAGLAGLAVVSIGVMMARRRLVEALVLAGPLVAMSFSVLPPGEMLRLPMIALVAVLAAGLLSTPAVRQVDEEAREARRLAKLEKKEAKERAKQERELLKHKDGLYAFDKPTRSEKKQRQKTRQKRKADDPSGILSATTDSEPAVPTSSRPI